MELQLATIIREIGIDIWFGNDKNLITKAGIQLRMHEPTEPHAFGSKLLPGYTAVTVRLPGGSGGLDSKTSHEEEEGDGEGSADQVGEGREGGHLGVDLFATACACREQTQAVHVVKGSLPLARSTKVNEGRQVQQVIQGA